MWYLPVSTWWPSPDFHNGSLHTPVPYTQCQSFWRQTYCRSCPPPVSRLYGCRFLEFPTEIEIYNTWKQGWPFKQVKVWFFPLTWFSPLFWPGCWPSQGRPAVSYRTPYNVPCPPPTHTLTHKTQDCIKNLCIQAYPDTEKTRLHKIEFMNPRIPWHRKHYTAYRMYVYPDLDQAIDANDHPTVWILNEIVQSIYRQGQVT